VASSTFKNKAVGNNTPITANTDILVNPLTFVPRELAPGGAGIYRLYFTFVFAADADAIISLSSKPAFADPEQLNSDQNFIIKSKGKYRFDIDIEEGDEIQIRSSVQITAIHKLRFHKIVFGA